MTQFTELKVKVCNSCNHQFTIKSHGHMLQVPIVESEKNINRMLNHLLAQSTTHDLRCSDCGTESYREQIQIKIPSNFLILHLQLWGKGANKQLVKNTNLQLNSLPSTDLAVDGIRYQLHAVLFHHGETAKQGHYTAIVRSGKKTILADDINVSSCRWPNGSAGAYMLFYINTGAKQSKVPQETGDLCSKLLLLKPRSKNEAPKVTKNQLVKDSTLQRAPRVTPVRVVDKPLSPEKPTALLLPAFINGDGVSCYANAILQCLLSSEPVRFNALICRK